ncbi:MAG TPA: YceI family protein [Gemmatimonadales bacterium]|nr:YceI family protein [Gemmatimonadales bacterium]
MSEMNTWSIDPTHSHIEFAIRHLMISTVKGRFSAFTGTVELDPDDLTTAKIDVAIQAASIDTHTTDRDNHLRSADFFDVATHPALTYASRRVEQRGDQFLVIGDLTIRGVTREVALAVTLEGTNRDPWGNDRMAFRATAGINRSDFGLTWNKALEAGGVLVGEEVKISIEVQLVPAPAEAGV